MAAQIDDDTQACLLSTMATSQSRAFRSFLDLPDELVNEILLRMSLPTFIQAVQSSKRFRDLARKNHKILAHHLRDVPGDKSILNKATPDEQDRQCLNESLFRHLQQRASKHLVGTNFTANCHEFIARSVQIDPFASAIEGFDADYLNLSLVFKDQIDIRQYTSHLRVKEKIEICLGSGWKIFKVVHWQRYTSALLSRSLNANSPADSDGDVQYTSPDDDFDIAQELAARSDRRPRPTCRATLLSHMSPFNEQPSQPPCMRREYMVAHFDIYSHDAPRVEVVKVPKATGHSSYVPTDFAVLDSTSCAILWNIEDPRAASQPRVTFYLSSPRPDCSPLDFKILWPKPTKGKKCLDVEDESAALKKCNPRRIAFFKDGRRLKLFGAGDIVPSELVSVQTTREQYIPTNELKCGHSTFKVDTPFYGVHTTKDDTVNGYKFCYMTYLCLATSKFDIDDAGDEQIPMLYILRSQTTTYSESCDHTVTLQKMPHLSSNNTVVVARLWGWEKWDTNLTGLETVAVSKHGTRIAVAVWNKVLVYALNPRVLCDDSIQDIPRSRKRKSGAQKASAKPKDFYHREHYRWLGRDVVNLKPIVLNLNGAVAHKMRWTVSKDAPSDDYPSEKAEDDAEDVDGKAELKGMTANGDNSSDQPPAVAPSPAEMDMAEAESNTETPMSTQTEVATATEAPQIEITKGESQPEVVAEQAVFSQEDTHTHPVTNLGTTNEISENNGLTDSQTVTQTAPPPPSPTVPLLVNSPLTPPVSVKTTFRKKDKQAEIHIADLTSVSHHDVPVPSQSASPFTAPKPEPSEILPLAQSSQETANPEIQKVSSSSEIDSSPNITTAVGVKAESTLAGGKEGQIQQVSQLDGSVVAASYEPLPDTGSAVKSEQDDTDKSKDVPCRTTNAADNSTQSEGKVEFRPKRITEDELLILTDRGVQLWNLGANGQGQRKRTILELEEAMNGKSPLRRTQME